MGYCHIWTLPAGKGFVERECKWSGAVISTACWCGTSDRWPFSIRHLHVKHSLSNPLG
jgi:hypothetical protein